MDFRGLLELLAQFLIFAVLTTLCSKRLWELLGWECWVLVVEYYKVSLGALICIAAKLLSSKSSAAFTAKTIFELWRRRAGDVELASGILK